MVPMPTTLLCNSETWRIENASRSGGPSTTGTQQFVISPAGRWRAKASFHLIEDDDYLEARGFIAGLDGQAGTFLIGPTDYRGQPWNIDPLTGGIITPDKAVRDAEIDPAFENYPDTTGRLDFVLADPVALNATSIAIQRNKGGRLKRGQYLQIGERLHIIIGLTTADPVDPGSGLAIAGRIGVTIRPWARAAYGSGTAVEFARPKCLMRLADADQGGVDMTTSPLSSLPLDIVEAV